MRAVLVFSLPEEVGRAVRAFLERGPGAILAEVRRHRAWAEGVVRACDLALAEPPPVGDS